VTGSKLQYIEVGFRNKETGEEHVVRIPVTAIVLTVLVVLLCLVLS